MTDFIYLAPGTNIYPAGPEIGVAVQKASAANTYGAWTQIVASTSLYVYIIGVKIHCNNANSYIQLNIGFGSSGSETSLAVLNLSAITANVDGYYIPLNPFLRISANTRIACRVAGSSSNADTINVVLHYVPAANVYNPILVEVNFPDGAVVADDNNSNISFKTNLTQTANDFWKDTFVKFKTGNLANQVRRVLAYNGATKFITCDAFTSTPAAGSVFDLINR